MGATTSRLAAAIGAVATAAFFAMAFPSLARADSNTIGRYMIAPQSNTGTVWQVDTMTGAMRLCLPPPDGRPVGENPFADLIPPKPDGSQAVGDKPAAVFGPPECGAWGP